MVSLPTGAVIWCNQSKSSPGTGPRMDRRNFIAGCAGLSLVATAGNALGQSGPLIKIIFPFSAGGSGDTLCRLLGQRMGQMLERTVIVESRTGGDGLIGIKAV